MWAKNLRVATDIESIIPVRVLPLTRVALQALAYLPLMGLKDARSLAQLKLADEPKGKSNFRAYEASSKNVARSN